MARIALENVHKVFHDGTEAVRGLNLEIEDGELVVLVGPSGCGKTTALRMVAGLEDVSAGSIFIGEKRVNDIDARDRDVAMVFQNYALYPHMSVRDNVGFPLRIAGQSKKVREGAVVKVARTLGLEPHLGRKPRQLSGGQRQRVAMGRAMVREPQVFLMDEPLSNLDAKLRVQMRAEISSLQRKLGVTTLYVTHDQVEAMTMGDRVAVLRGGELQQFGTPQEVYDTPANVFVAGFIGSPPMNLMEGEVVVDGGRPSVDLGAQRVAIDETELARNPKLRTMAGSSFIVGIRPEDLDDAALSSGIREDRVLNGTVLVREALGSDALLHVVVSGARPIRREVLELAHDVEDSTELDDLARDTTHVVIGRFSPRSQAAEDASVRMAVLPGAMQFFDARTGAATRHEQT